jgi:archaellum component FlaG (FlaF/FlaG flagellin family)
MSLVSQLSSESENGNDKHKKWFSISSDPKGYPEDGDGKNTYIKELHLSRINGTFIENQSILIPMPRERMVYTVRS